MEESETSMEVRSLTGESIVLSILPDKTIQQLKQLLKKTFQPASISPNFHLFLKAISYSSHLFHLFYKFYESCVAVW